MKSSTIDNDLALELIYEWVETTEKIIGAGLRKKKVKISDTSRKNIRIQVIESLKNSVEIHFFFRDALRFVDMAAGNGYHKGKKIGRIDTNAKGRRKKKIINKPLYTQLARLTGQISTKILEEASLIFQDNT